MDARQSRHSSRAIARPPRAKWGGASGRRARQICQRDPEERRELRQALGEAKDMARKFAKLVGKATDVGQRVVGQKGVNPLPVGVARERLLSTQAALQTFSFEVSEMARKQEVIQQALDQKPWGDWCEEFLLSGVSRAHVWTKVPEFGRPEAVVDAKQRAGGENSAQTEPCKR